MSLVTTLFKFEGRMRRLPFIGYSLLSAVGFFVVLMAMWLIVVIFGTATVLVSGSTEPFVRAVTDPGTSVLVVVPTIALWWISAAVMIKRLHDLGFHGVHAIWIQGLAFGASFATDIGPSGASDVAEIAGIVSGCVFLALCVAPGNSTDNKYGPAFRKDVPALV